MLLTDDKNLALKATVHGFPAVMQWTESPLKLIEHLQMANLMEVDQVQEALTIESDSTCSLKSDVAVKTQELCEVFTSEVTPILQHRLSSMLGELWRDVVPAQPWTCENILQIILTNWQILFSNVMSSEVKSRISSCSDFLHRYYKCSKKNHSKSNILQSEYDEFFRQMEMISNIFGGKR